MLQHSRMRPEEFDCVHVCANLRVSIGGACTYALERSAEETPRSKTIESTKAAMCSVAKAIPVFACPVSKTCSDQHNMHVIIINLALNAKRSADSELHAGNIMSESHARPLYPAWDELSLIVHSVLVLTVSLLTSLKNLGISCSIVYLTKLYVACATNNTHVAGAAYVKQNTPIRLRGRRKRNMGAHM